MKLIWKKYIFIFHNYIWLDVLRLDLKMSGLRDEYFLWQSTTLEMWKEVSFIWCCILCWHPAADDKSTSWHCTSRSAPVQQLCTFFSTGPGLQYWDCWPHYWGERSDDSTLCPGGTPGCEIWEWIKYLSTRSTNKETGLDEMPLGELLLPSIDGRDPLQAVGGHCPPRLVLTSTPVYVTKFIFHI